MKRYCFALPAFIAVILAYSPRVLGYDVEVSLDSEFRAYEVRSPSSSVFWARRRVVDTLSLRYVQPLSARAKYPPGPRIQAHVSLRLYQEFGETCLVADEICLETTDPSASGSYQPLARDNQIDAPFAYVEASALPLDARVRAGRQIYWDRIGFTRFDGGAAGVEPWPWLHLQAFGGALVTNTSVAGSSAFTPTGIPRLELDRYERARAPFIAPPVNVRIVGATLDVGSADIVQIGANFRELWPNRGVVQQRGALGAVSQPVDPLHLEADAVWDLVDLTLVDAQVDAQVRLMEITWRLTGQRHVPRFDMGTIWAYFDVAPTWEEKFGASWSANSVFDVGGALCGRQAELGNRYDHDFGLEGNASTRLGAVHLEISGFAWTGNLGPVWGANLDGTRPIASWLVVQGRVSLWRVENVLRPEIKGMSLSETIGVDIPLTDTTVISSELSHAYSSVVGNRFWFFALLHLGAWR